MFATMTRESLDLFRHPTVSTVRRLRRDDLRSGMLFFFVTMALAIGLNYLAALVQGPAREVQQQQLLEQLGPSALTGLYDVIQSPVWIVGIGLVGMLIGFVLWFVVPYGLGRAFGGTPGFGAYTYANALSLGPLTVLDALFAVLFSGVAGGLYLILSLSLDVFRFYLVWANLRGTMGLSGWKAGMIVALPIIIALSLCSLFVFVVFALAFTAALNR